MEGLTERWTENAKTISPLQRRRVMKHHVLKFDNPLLSNIFNNVIVMKPMAVLCIYAKIFTFSCQKRDCKVILVSNDK